MAEVLSTAASIFNLLQLSVTLLKVLQDIRGASRERMRLRDEIRGSICLLEMLKDRIEDEHAREEWSSSLRSLNSPGGPLETFKAALELLTAKLVPSSRLKQRIQPLTWLLDKAEIGKVLAVIDRHKHLFSLALHNDHLHLSQAMIKDVQSISSRVSDLQSSQSSQERRLEQSEDRALLAWLSPLNFFPKHDDIVSRREEGTGQWLLETPEFQGWIHGRERTLWCSGIPGTGKTTLASIMIDHLQQLFKAPEISVMFVYCNYKERDDHTPSNLMASLLQQLVQSLPNPRSIPAQVRSLYDHHKRRMTRPSINELSGLIRAMVAQFSKVFLILDALDECTEDTRSDLVMEIHRLPSNLFFLCTSRFAPDIEDVFRDAPKIEIRANDADVRKYLEAQLQKESRLKRHVDAEPNLLEEIVSTIIVKVQGMFLLAQLHLESLSKKQSRKAVRSALSNLPRKLDDTYEEAMQRIYDQDSEDIELAEKVLMWISFARRPMTVREIQHGVAVMNLANHEDQVDDEGLPQPELLVTVCAGIVTIDKESDILRLVHYTTQEYFERVRLLKFPAAQSSITKACVRYLTLENVSNGPAPTDEILDSCLKTNALLRYAAQNWGHHVRGPLEVECQDIILELFQQKVAFQVAVQVWRIPEYHYESWSQVYAFDVPPIVYAASFGLNTTIQTLIKNGANINSRSTNDDTAMMVAATEGYSAVVETLLTADADVNSVDAAGWTALVRAADQGHENVVVQLLGSPHHAVEYKEMALRQASRKGHIGIVIQLLKAGTQVNATDVRDGQTALMLAADNGYAIVTTQLILAGANCEAKDPESDRTALIRAAERGHETVVKSLIIAGADITAKDRASGRNALSRAARNGHMGVVELLLQAGSDIALKDNSGWTCFMGAVDNGHDTIVSLLLQKGADAKDSSDWSALMRAAGNGHQTVLKLLLDAGADLEVRDTAERTALMHAAYNGHTSIVQELIAAGADVRARTSTGYTAALAAAKYQAIVDMLSTAESNTVQATMPQNMALIDAATMGQDTLIEQLLLVGDEKINMIDQFGWTALMRAADNGHALIVIKLLEAGADYNLKDQAEWTALSRAASQGHEECLVALLAAGADIEARNLVGWTALEHAANNGHHDLVRRLLAAAANPSTKDISEWSPLMRAADNGHSKVVQLLLDAGADRDAIDRSGWTALCRAADKCHEEVVKSLIGSGADVSKKDFSEWSPLGRAAVKGNATILRMLLLAGADVTVKSQREWSTEVRRSTTNYEPILKEITAAWEKLRQKKGINGPVSLG